MPTPEELKAAAEKAAAEKAAAEEETAKKVAEEEEYDAWLAKQPADVQKRIADSTTGLKSALKKEREANKDASPKLKRLDELEAVEKKRAEEKLSEDEKAKLKLSEAETAKAKAETELQGERMRNAVILEATKQGFTDPDDAYNLADLSTLEFEDDGRPTKDSVRAALEVLAKDKPYLVGNETKRVPEIDARSRSTKLQAGSNEIIEKKRREYSSPL